MIALALMWVLVFIVLVVEKSRFARWMPILLVALVVYGAWASFKIYRGRHIGAEEPEADEESEPRRRAPGDTGSKTNPKRRN